MDISSDQSVYMSIPYLSPAIFLIGAIILFTGTFKSTERNRLPLFKRIQAPIMIGTIIIALSFVVMMMLTPFWYIFLGIYVLFIAFIIWQKYFNIIKITGTHLSACFVIYYICSFSLSSRYAHGLYYIDMHWDYDHFHRLNSKLVQCT